MIKSLFNPVPRPRHHYKDSSLNSPYLTNSTEIGSQSLSSLSSGSSSHSISKRETVCLSLSKNQYYKMVEELGEVEKRQNNLYQSLKAHTQILEYGIDNNVFWSEMLCLKYRGLNDRMGQDLMKKGKGRGLSKKQKGILSKKQPGSKVVTEPLSKIKGKRQKTISCNR